MTSDPAAHHEHGDDHRDLATACISDPAEQPAAEGPHEEPHGKDTGGGQELARLISRWKESGGEVDRGIGIGEKIVPLDQVSEQAPINPRMRLLF